MSERVAIRGKFTADTAWNLGAYGLMAATGAIINLFVAGQRGGEALGVFNQVYAIYVVVAQLAVWGVHDSAQKHAAEHADAPRELAAIARGAVVACCWVAAPTAVVVALVASSIGAVTDSEAVGQGVLAVAPGLLFFALNKTLLGLLNGLRRMRAYALGQSTRILTILAVVVGVGASELPDWALVAGFTVAEIVLLPVLLVALRRQLRGAPRDSARAWSRRHLRFGLHALPNSFLAESFIRIDIIMLGLFVSDAEVGVYSFAALFVEGLYQIAVVVRTVSNPVLVKLLADGQHGGVASFCRRTGVLSLLLTTVAAVVVYAAFPVLAHWVPVDLVVASRRLLQVLLFGLCVYAAFVPSDYLLLQAGLPGKQSVLMTANVLVNVVLNGVLIMHYGTFGAALATASAYGFSAVALNVAAARWLGMKRTVFLTPRGRR